MGYTEFWLGILSVLVLFLSIFMALVIRQIGILLNYVGPVGARSISSGPRVGENIKLHIEKNITLLLMKPTLLIFGSKSCSVCSAIKDATLRLYKFWDKKADFVFVYDDIDRIETQRDQILVFQNSSLREVLNIRTLPVAVMLDTDGVVTGQGLVNDISQLESLLETVRISS